MQDPWNFNEASGFLSLFSKLQERILVRLHNTNIIDHYKNTLTHAKPRLLPARLLLCCCWGRKVKPTFQKKIRW